MRSPFIFILFVICYLLLITLGNHFTIPPTVLHIPNFVPVLCNEKTNMETLYRVY
jgi:hypothetical protein